MKHLKKIIAFVLVAIMAMSLATTAFAAEETATPENATRHTVELTVAPDGTVQAVNGDYSVAPAMWNNGQYSLVSGSVTYVPVTIPDRYFAIEASGVDSNGNAFNETFSVALVSDITSVEVIDYVTANGSIKKIDWIDVIAGNRYQIRIGNTTSRTITVTLTYYSWA